MRSQNTVQMNPGFTVYSVGDPGLCGFSGVSRSIRSRLTTGSSSQTGTLLTTLRRLQPHLRIGNGWIRDRPLVFRTETLGRLRAIDLGTRARDAAAVAPKDVLARTAAFFLLKHSRSSFSIEGKHPPQDRVQR